MQPQPSTAAARAAAAAEAATTLQGGDIIASPNVFGGIKPTGELLAQPAQLGREEELEYVRRALFFIASNDAQRALAERALCGTDGCSLEVEDDLLIDDTPAVFNHEEILAEMRRASSAAAEKQREAARNRRTAEIPCKVPPNLSDTEFRLMVSVGRAAYNKLFHHNRKLIYYEVNKVCGTGYSRATVMEKADFLQEGAQGLLRAIRLFDTARGVRFSTYASWHVRAFVLRSLRDKSHIVRLPQKLQEDMMQIRKARYRYAVENQGHEPREAALAEMLHFTPTRVREALKGLASASAASLDVPLSAVGSNPSHEPLGSSVASTKNDAAASENELYQTQLQNELEGAMAGRDPRRTKITRLKYGMEDGVEWTYAQLAERFNTTTSVTKSIVRSEVAFLRRFKRRELHGFVQHL
jgi:RNA polymerase sigma factor (sigma-70 family)